MYCVFLCFGKLDRKRKKERQRERERGRERDREREKDLEREREKKRDIERDRARLFHDLRELIYSQLKVLCVLIHLMIELV